MHMHCYAEHSMPATTCYALFSAVGCCLKSCLLLTSPKGRDFSFPFLYAGFSLLGCRDTASGQGSLEQHVGRHWILLWQLTDIAPGQDSPKF